MWWCVCVLSAVTVTSVRGDIPPSSPTLSAANSNTPLWNATWTDHLKHDLLMKYDKFARPAQHNNITEVRFGVEIKHVEVDEGRALMTVNAFTRLTWQDEKLQWNESDYGGLKTLHVADHEIWQPDIVLYTSAIGNSIDHYGNTHLMVNSTGHVLWVPPSQFSVYCDLNFRKWPYDEQTCTFYFGSWTYSGDEIFLKRPANRNTSDAVIELTPGLHWTVLSAKEIEITKYYDCCGSTPWYTIQLEVKVRRNNPAYGFVAFTPAIVCVVLTLALFWMPPEATEKFMLAGVTAVIECMFLLYFAQRLPLMGQHTPLIVKFYGYSLCLVALSVVVSVLTSNMSRRLVARPVPWFISRALAQYAVFLGISNNKHEFVSMYDKQDCEELHERSLVDRTRTESVDTTHQISSTQTAREWVLLASALDRLMFILYVVIFLLIGASFFLS